MQFSTYDMQNRMRVGPWWLSRPPTPFRPFPQ